MTDDHVTAPASTTYHPAQHTGPLGGTMKCIVVGTDLAARSQLAVEQAADLAEATGAALHLVSACAGPVVATGTEVVGVADHNEYIDAVQTELDAMVEGLRRRDIGVETHLSVGPAAAVICKVADEVDADVIVVGNKRLTGAGRILGSVAKRVLQHADCHVMIAHTG